MNLKKDAPIIVTFQEAAIDSISYQELFGQKFQNSRVIFQSLEGIKENIAINSLRRVEEKYGKKADMVIVATDNDKAGNVS